MKRTLFVFSAAAALAVAMGLWFSPLAPLGRAYYCRDNTAIGEIEGVVYFSGDVRADFDGDESDMFAALERISARVVKTEETDGLVIAYAFSPRVAAAARKTADGDSYNVMAACSERGVSIGAPVLSGCY